MRILHLAPFLQGGAGRAITELALEQHRAGHDVRVVASDTAPAGYGNYPAYLDRLAAAGVPVRLVDSLFDRRHSVNLAVVEALEEIYAPGDEPDVLHAHAAIPGLVALVFAGARRVRPSIVQTMHGWGVTKTLEQTATDVSVLNLVDRVIVPSRASADTLIALGVAPARLSVIPYGIGPALSEPEDRDRILLAEMAERRRQGALVVAAIGTLSARKRQTLIVDAIARVRRTPVFLVVVGDGDDTELRAAIDRGQADPLVRVHGYSAAARQIAAAADVLVLASESEGQPLSILEAFADGTVPLVSDIPELCELVDDGETGFRTASGQPDALARALERIHRLSGPARRAITARARRRFERDFTLEIMVARYEVAYQVGAGASTPVRRRKVRRAA